PPSPTHIYPLSLHDALPILRRLQHADRPHQQTIARATAARRRIDQDRVGRDLSMAILEVVDDARVRVLTLNRPEALNAFNDELYHSAGAALEEAAERADVACVG